MIAYTLLLSLLVLQLHNAFSDAKKSEKCFAKCVLGHASVNWCKKICGIKGHRHYRMGRSADSLEAEEPVTVDPKEYVGTDDYVQETTPEELVWASSAPAADQPEGYRSANDYSEETTVAYSESTYPDIVTTEEQSNAAYTNSDYVYYTDEQGTVTTEYPDIRSKNMQNKK